MLCKEAVSEMPSCAIPVFERAELFYTSKEEVC